MTSECHFCAEEISDVFFEHECEACEQTICGFCSYEWWPDVFLCPQCTYERCGGALYHCRIMGVPEF